MDGAEELTDLTAPLSMMGLPTEALSTLEGTIIHWFVGWHTKPGLASPGWQESPGFVYVVPGGTGGGRLAGVLARRAAAARTRRSDPGSRSTSTPG